MMETKSRKKVKDEWIEEKGNENKEGTNIV